MSDKFFPGNIVEYELEKDDGKYVRHYGKILVIDEKYKVMHVYDFRDQCEISWVFEDVIKIAS